MKMNNATPQQATVISHTEVAPGVFILRFTRPADQHFKAGQMVWVRYPTQGPARLYSIASGENEPFYEIIYNVVKEGALTPTLSQVKVGETIWISHPAGKFTSAGNPAVWIATGTGIAPFASMVRSGFTAETLLIQGGRDKNSFYYQDIFNQTNNLAYVKCMSRKQAEGYFHGRVTHFIENEYQPLPHRQHLLCGSAEMVVEVRDLLIRKGIPYQNIVSEIYF
ncbi:MAG: ferredoxin--NADP reductase [Bacteroidales bacterium]